MAEFYNAVYTKVGASFANDQESVADKIQFYPPGLHQSVIDCYEQMLIDGVLLEPVYGVWDQATYTQTTFRRVSSVEAYQQAVTFDLAACIQAAEQAGWTFIP